MILQETILTLEREFMLSMAMPVMTKIRESESESFVQDPIMLSS